MNRNFYDHSIAIVFLSSIALLQISLHNLAVNAQGFKAAPHYYLVLPINLISRVKLPSHVGFC